MTSLKGDLTAVGIGLSAGIVCVLLLWFALSAAKAALTPEHAARYRHGPNWVCPLGMGCTNPAHLNAMRRTNHTDYIGTPGGSVGIRLDAGHK